MKLFALGHAVLAFAAFAAVSAKAEPIETLYAAAKKEGALTIYGGGPAAQYEPWAREFEQRFPGIKVTTKAGSSNVLADEIDAQMKAHNLQVDLPALQTIQDYERWQQAGALLPFKPDGFEKVDDEWKDKDGAYVGITVYGLGYSYNTSKLSAGAVPKSAPDFLRPEFKDKIITTYPHVDDVTLYLYQTIVDKYGWEFLDKLKANRPAFVRGHLGVARAVASSAEKTLTFDASVSMTLAEAQSGKPTAVSISDIDAMPIYAQIAAVLKDAPHPNAAKLYIAWFMQPEQQSRQGIWSSRSDVPPPPGLKSLSAYKLANNFRSFIMDQDRVKALRDRYLDFTGPVSNAGTYR
jgi:ABC-type Fe3+ transport system substrate-binding protein